MKQITLHPNLQAGAPRNLQCLPKIAICWAAYGCAMSFLWQALPRAPLTDAAAWLVALLGGLALAAWTAEV